MKYILSIVLICFCLSGYTQEKHFMFIQSDNNQPFYVSLNGKLYSSTASGYVIIPKLADGDYNFTIGFAQNTYPEQTFQYSINKKDLGFNLKNFGEKGWGLFNLQSLDVTMATTGNGSTVAKAVAENVVSKEKPEPLISFEKKKEKAPAEVASIEARDTLNEPSVSLKEEPLKQELKLDTSMAIINRSDSPTNTPPTNTPPTSTPTTSDVTVNANSNISKISEVKAVEGITLSYSEKNEKSTDTIQVIIPSTSTSSFSNSTTNAADSAPKTNGINVTPSNPLSTAKGHLEKEGLKFLDLDMKGVKKDTITTTNQVQGQAGPMPNSNCVNIANEEDYVRLRKKMAMETSDEKMISEARKVYRNKCFTTSQIKGLSTLFLSDEGRFKFFDASFLSVADVSEYSKLQSEFIDPAYLAKFKAMLQ